MGQTVSHQYGGIYSPDPQTVRKKIFFQDLKIIFSSRLIVQNATNIPSLELIMLWVLWHGMWSSCSLLLSMFLNLSKKIIFF